MGNFRDRLFRRIAAMQNAKAASNKKMQEANTADQYWHGMRKDPDVNLTDAQLAEVHKFWDKYAFAYKNTPRTQAFFSALSGRFDPCYCEIGLMTYYMWRFYDQAQYHTAFHDKNYREFLFHDVPYTPAYIHRIRGQYYDQNFQHISYDRAMSTLEELVAGREEKLIVKPTPGGGGNGISFIRRGDTKEEISEHLDAIKNDDLIIERFVKAHPSFAAANPTSLNSLRIVTFMYDGEIEVIAILFRMGAVSKEVDNFTQGGVACGVSEGGVCMDYGVDHWGNRYDVHPSGFRFAGHKLYGVDQAVALAKKLHERIPQFRQMSWDIAVDENGVATLIEMNPRGEAGIYEAIGRLPFGKRTASIIDEYLFIAFFNRGANWRWDYNEYADHIVLTKYGWERSTVRVPEKINGKTVTHIAANCFSGQRIKRIIIPGCVKSWDDRICAEMEHQPEITWLEDNRGIIVPAVEQISGGLRGDGNYIQWEPVEGVTTYHIYRMQQGQEREFIKAVSSYTTAYKDHNVLDGVLYYYYVRTHDSSCNIFGDWSRAVGIRTRLSQGVLPAVEQISGGVRGDGNRIQWEPVEGASSYYIYRMQQGQEREFIKTVDSYTTAYKDHNVLDGVLYYYYVRAYDSSCGVLSDWSRAVGIRTRLSQENSGTENDG